MTTPDAKRRLLWHGVLLFLLGLLIGAVVQSFANPRMALSAHVGFITTGTFVGVIGLAWSELRLDRGAAATALWLTLYGAWVSSLGLFFAALFGTGSMTPIAGGGRTAAAWQEGLVNFCLVSAAGAMLVGVALILWGLGGRRATRTA